MFPYPFFHHWLVSHIQDQLIFRFLKNHPKIHEDDQTIHHVTKLSYMSFVYSLSLKQYYQNYDQSMKISLIVKINQIFLSLVKIDCYFVHIFVIASFLTDQMFLLLD